MATGPIETHLHRSFNWENGAPGPREGQRGRSARCGNGLFAQCVRLRSEINLPDVGGISKPARQLMGKPPETTHFTRGRRRAATCGFSISMKAARVNSLAIAAGGLRAKGRLSFKTGVFGDIEPPKAARCALWDKNKNSKP